MPESLNNLIAHIMSPTAVPMAIVYFAVIAFAGFIAVCCCANSALKRGFARLRTSVEVAQHRAEQLQSANAINKKLLEDLKDLKDKMVAVQENLSRTYSENEALRTVIAQLERQLEDERDTKQADLETLQNILIEATKQSLAARSTNTEQTTSARPYDDWARQTGLDKVQPTDGPINEADLVQAGQLQNEAMRQRRQRDEKLKKVNDKRAKMGLYPVRD